MKYDPRAAYFARMNKTQKKAISSRNSHTYSDSIGGDSSNYQNDEKQEDKNDNE